MSNCQSVYESRFYSNPCTPRLAARAPILALHAYYDIVRIAVTTLSVSVSVFLFHFPFPFPFPPFTVARIFNINHSAFSQAPGAGVLLLCNNSHNMIVYTTCQDDGRWEPDASSALCLNESSHNNNTGYAPCEHLVHRKESLFTTVVTWKFTVFLISVQLFSMMVLLKYNKNTINKLF